MLSFDSFYETKTRTDGGVYFTFLSILVCSIFIFRSKEKGKENIENREFEIKTNEMAYIRYAST